MTEEDFLAYMAFQVKLAKIEGADLDKALPPIIQIGLAEFWGAKPWQFRRRPYDLAITASADSYELSKEFDAFEDVHEEDSTLGLQLVYKPYMKFRSMFPRTDVVPTGYPKFFTFFQNRDEDFWRVTFMPRPDAGMTVKLQMLTKPSGSIEDVPDKLLGGLTACCMQHLMNPGSPQRITAIKEVESKINILFAHDDPFGQPLLGIRTENDEPDISFLPEVLRP